MKSWWRGAPEVALAIPCRDLASTLAAVLASPVVDEHGRLCERRGEVLPK